MSDIGSPLALAALTDGEDTAAAKVTRAARALCEFQTEAAPLIGHVTIGVFADGGFSFGFSCPTEHPIIGPVLFTAFVREIIRQKMTGVQAADEYARDYLL